MNKLLLTVFAVLALSACTPTPGEAYLAEFEKLEADLAQLAEQAEVCFSEIEATMDKYDHLNPSNQNDFDNLFSEAEQQRYNEIENAVEEQLKKLRDIFDRDC